MIETILIFKYNIIGQFSGALEIIALKISKNGKYNVVIKVREQQQVNHQLRKGKVVRSFVRDIWHLSSLLLAMR